MSDKQKTVVHLSLGFVLVIIIHAVLTSLLNRVPIPGVDDYRQARQVESYSFDTVQSGIGSPNRVNATARDEAKKQQVCVPCTIAQVQPVVVQPVKQKEAPKFNLDLFLDSSSESQTIASWFNNDANLKKFKASCNFQAYGPDNALYKARYANVVTPSQFPAVVFTQPDGGHIYVAGKGQFPSTAQELYSDIAKAYNLFKSIKDPAQAKGIETIDAQNLDCPDGNCPVPNDTRQPFFPLRDRDREPLLPNLKPPQIDPVSLFFRQTGLGLESLALLVMGGVFVVFVVVLLRRSNG